MKKKKCESLGTKKVIDLRLQCHGIPDHEWCQERELFDGTDEYRFKPEEMLRDQLL